MKLIKEIGSILINGRKRKAGLFYCPLCKKEAIKGVEWGPKAKTCGCQIGWHLIKHKCASRKLGRKRIYKMWGNIKDRCYNNNAENYKMYGAKGVTLCDEWIESFISFRDWALNNGYDDKLTIDRIEGSKGYSPDNCRFIPMLNNSIKNSTVKLNFEIAEKIRSDYKNKVLTRFALAEKYNVTPVHITAITSYRVWKWDYDKDLPNNIKEENK